MTKTKAVMAALSWGFSGVIGGILVAEAYDDPSPPAATEAPEPSRKPHASPRPRPTPKPPTPTPKPPAPPPRVGKALRQALLRTSELRLVVVGEEDVEDGRVPGLENTDPAATNLCEGETVRSTTIADDPYQAWDVSLWGEEAVGNEITSFYDNGAARFLSKVRAAAQFCVSPSFRLRASPQPERVDDLIHIVRDSPEPDDQYAPPENWIFIRRGQVVVQLVLRKAHGRHSEWALRLALQSASRLH